MSAATPTILATSADLLPGPTRLPLDVRLGPIHHFAAELAGAGEQARFCTVHQAQGDPPDRIAAAYAAFAKTSYRLSHLQLFPQPNHEDVRDHLLQQDVIWVDGGSVANLLAVWRVHGLDTILHEAWQAGIVLAGVSAGSICWHSGGVTDSFGPELRPFTDGLGWLPHSNGVHYDTEVQRRPAMHRSIADGTLPDGYATDDGAGLVFHGTGLAEVVSDREGPRGYELRRAPDGSVVETPLPTRVLR